MKRLFTLKVFTKITLLLLVAVAFFACQKEIENDGTITPPVTDPNTGLDLTTKVNALSISGFVTDEANAAVENATVTIGSVTIITDKYGYFETRNVSVVKNAAVITVSKSGYFKGIKTYIAETGKSAFFRIKLLAKTPASAGFSSATGGTVTSADGIKITFPADAIVTSTGASYSGNVVVAARFIDPTSAELNKIMPGDLRGIDSMNTVKKLTTYGMAAVELTGASGEAVKIAPGKKATLSFPLPSSISSTAPASIPLWHFDETLGLWKQEGNAVKTGNAYVGDVSHFSFWNCDVPNNYVQVHCIVKTTAGSPLAFSRVKLSVIDNPQNFANGYTDSSGYVTGAVPSNSTLKLEVFIDNSCSISVHSQTLNTTNTDLSVAVNVNPPVAYLANVSGVVTDCNNAAVTNGFVIVIINKTTYHYNLNNTGSFSFIHTLCNTADSASFIGIDLNNPQQNVTVDYKIVTGNNQVPGLKVCTQTPNTQQFITYTLGNGIEHPFSSSNAGDSLYHKLDSAGSAMVAAFRRDSSLNGQISSFVQIRFTTAGIALGSNQNLLKLYGDGIFVPSSIPSPITVKITEFGAIGEYISGNFAGQIIGQYASPTVLNTSGSFRIKRTF